MKIPIDSILVEHGNNVSRESFTPDSCSELAESIGRFGLIEPLIVKETSHPDYDYQLVVGYRRYTACIVLGWTEVEVLVRPSESEHQDKLINIAENLMRENPSFWGWCCALRDTFEPGTGDTEIARILGKSRSWVRVRWLVWRLPDDVIAQVEAGYLSAADVSLLIQKSPEEQQAAADRILKGKAAGETTQSLQTELSNRRSVRPKKEVQAMMTKFMEEEKEAPMHALRWAIGEITDTQLLNLI